MARMCGIIALVLFCLFPSRSHASFWDEFSVSANFDAARDRVSRTISVIAWLEYYTVLCVSYRRLDGTTKDCSNISDPSWRSPTSYLFTKTYVNGNAVYQRFDSAYSILPGTYTIHVKTWGSAPKSVTYVVPNIVDLASQPMATSERSSQEAGFISKASFRRFVDQISVQGAYSAREGCTAQAGCAAVQMSISVPVAIEKRLLACLAYQRVDGSSALCSSNSGVPVAALMNYGWQRTSDGINAVYTIRESSPFASFSAGHYTVLVRSFDNSIFRSSTFQVPTNSYTTEPPSGSNDGAGDPGVGSGGSAPG